MLFVISLIVVILLASGVIWIRNKWVIDSFNSYGVYGAMAGLYLYRKFGIWHIGMSQDNTSKVEREKEFESIVGSEMDLKPSYNR